MGFSLTGAIKSAASYVGDKVGDAEDAVDDAKSWVGGKIDDAVQGAEKGLDSVRSDIRDFGEHHGGIVGKVLGETVSDGLGVVEGAGLAVYDMGKGVVQLADGAGKLLNPVEWATHGSENLQRLEHTGMALKTLSDLSNPVAWATNPQANINTSKALWNGVTGGYQDAAKQGDWSKFVGRGVVDIGSLLIGAGEANAAIKGAEGASAVGKIGEASEGVNVLGKAGEATRGLDSANAVSKSAEAAETASKIETASTFKTLGMDQVSAEGFLQTPAGGVMVDTLRMADPGADAATIHARAMDNLSTGVAAPEAKVVSSPLVKLVPQGQSVTPYSPFFATMDDVKAAAASGRPLADAFGLPIKSEAKIYDIYQITPNSPTTVFLQDVAPTSELDGAVERSGGAAQYLVLNRDDWSKPSLVGSIAN